MEPFEIQGIDNGFIAARLDAERAGRTRGVFHHLGGRPQDEAGRHDFAKRKCKILKGAQRWTRVGAAQADLPDRHQHDQQTKPHEKQRTQTDEPAEIFYDQHNALIEHALKQIGYSNARDQDEQKERDWENRNIPSYGVVLWGMFYRWTQKQVFDYMQYVVETMEHSAIEALKGDIDMAGIISPAAGKVESYVKKDRRALDMGVMNSAVPWAMATMEYSSAMGVVLCAPTGGSAGIFPGAVLGVANHLGLSMDEKIKAMLVTAIIGIVMSKDCNYSAELYGCQVEPGAASGMAAGGLVYLMGGTPEQCCQAASCAVQNILGTICDPVAGLVQIPCINRNAMSAANAVVSANMIMGGFDPLIPLDQTAETLFRVGRQLPSELRCTCRGGLCITPCGQKLAAEQDARNNTRTAAQA